MIITPTILPEVLIIEPDVFADSRGQFFEAFHKSRYQTLGIDVEFVQDNVSISMNNVLRGLHFQFPYPQDKLVSVLNGEILDVAVDIRSDSPTFAQWISVVLNANNKKQLYIPCGFAHGFMAMQDDTVVSYKCTEFYNANTERSILWNDPTINILWPNKQPNLSSKDAKAQRLDQFLSHELPKKE